MGSTTTGTLVDKAKNVAWAILRRIDNPNSASLRPYLPTLRSLLFGAMPPFIGGASLYALFQRHKFDRSRIEQLAFYVSYIVQQTEDFADIKNTPSLVIEALEWVMHNAIEKDQVTKSDGEQALKVLRKRVWSEHEEEIQGDEVNEQVVQHRVLRSVKRRKFTSGHASEGAQISEPGYQRDVDKLRWEWKKKNNTKPKDGEIQAPDNDMGKRSVLRTPYKDQLGVSVPDAPRRNPSLVLHPLGIESSDEFDSGVGLHTDSSHNSNQEDDRSWDSDF